MENLLTFVETYRDMDFTQMPFCVVDSLILSQISYSDYGKSPFVRKEFSVPLCTFYQNCDTETILTRTLMKDGDRLMIESLKSGGRHGDLRVSNYVNVVNDKDEIQFSAILFELGNDEYYIAFRGTDNTVAGWKEDLNLTHLDKIPAQKAALEYAMNIFGEFAGNFYIGGHSKGGNLAVYVAMNLPSPYKDRLLEVYNFDGPGFMEEVYESSEYQEIRALVHKYVPESSVIGMLWERDNNYIVVESDDKGLLQHNPHTWVVQDRELKQLEDVDSYAKYWKRTIERWIEELSFEERERLIDIIFDMIWETGIHNFYQLEEETLHKIRTIAEGYGELTDNERRFVRSAIRQLFLISMKEIPQAIKEFIED